MYMCVLIYGHDSAWVHMYCTHPSCMLTHACKSHWKVGDTKHIYFSIPFGPLVLFLLDCLLLHYDLHVLLQHRVHMYM